MVNKILLFIFITLTLTASAQNAEEVFNSANRFYQQKQYAKAVQLYEELINTGYEGVSIYYNLGNSYFRMGKTGFAILYYEKALKLSPGDEDIKHNLKIANAATVDKLTEFPPFFLFALWEDLLGFFTLTGWIYITYIFFILVLLTAAGYLLLRNAVYQKYSFLTGIVAVVFFIFSLTIMIVKLNRDINITNGIITEHEINVKISPDESSNDAFIVHEGLKVRLEGKIGDWVRVRLNDGKTGWIQESNIKTI